MILVMMVFVYFLMIRPENKRRQEQEDMLKSLRKGQKVRTSGGILGEIVSINDKDAVVSIANNVRITILRSHITALEVAEKAEDKKDEKKAEEKPADKG